MSATLEAPARSGPPRSVAQRMDALRYANEVRVRRAKIKREIAAGEWTATAVLQSVDRALQSWKVFDLLMAMPKYGRVKASRVMNQCRISQSKTVGGLSDRQRDELVDLLDGR